MSGRHGENHEPETNVEPTLEQLITQARQSTEAEMSVQKGGVAHRSRRKDPGAEGKPRES